MILKIQWELKIKIQISCFAMNTMLNLYLNMKSKKNIGNQKNIQSNLWLMIKNSIKKILRFHKSFWNLSDITLKVKTFSHCARECQEMVSFLKIYSIRLMYVIWIQVLETYQKKNRENYSRQIWKILVSILDLIHMIVFMVSGLYVILVTKTSWECFQFFIQLWNLMVLWFFKNRSLEMMKLLLDFVHQDKGC